MPRGVDGLNSDLEFEAPDINISSIAALTSLVARQTLGRDPFENRRDTHFKNCFECRSLSLRPTPRLAVY